MENVKRFFDFLMRHRGFGLRSASVCAEQTSPGRLAVYAPLRSALNGRPPDVQRPDQLRCPEFNSPYINRKRKPPLLRVMVFFF